MFNKNKIEKLKKINRDLEYDISYLKSNLEACSKSNQEYSEKLSKKDEEFDYKLSTLKQKHADEIDRLNTIKENELLKQEQVNKKTISDLTIKKEILEGKVVMYEKAFENMGFDVKDMKEILNTLADALKVKNTVQVVK